MALFIGIDNVADGVILGRQFTVYGTFSLAWMRFLVRNTTRYAVKGSKKASRAKAKTDYSITCDLQTTGGQPLASGNVVSDENQLTWQADFDCPASADGMNRKIVYSIQSGGQTQPGVPITGVEIRHPLEISISPMPPLTAGTALRERVYSPVGDFRLDPNLVAAFESVIIIHGHEKHKRPTTFLRVFNVKQTWELTASHKFNHPTGKRASHVVKLEMRDGTIRSTSRQNL